MDRRKFIQVVGFAGATIATAKSTRASIRSLGLVNTPWGPQQVQQAYVQQPTRIVQQCAEWCWAASCSMIFSMWGHKFDQTQIVNRVFNGIACAPAGNAVTMAEVLSDTWTDISGKTFSSRLTAAYDAQFGINAIDNRFIVNELTRNHPILYANMQHAMVIVTVDFIPTQTEPNILNIGVLDPWPYSPAYHSLTPPEMIPRQLGGQMTFLGAVQVT